MENEIAHEYVDVTENMTNLQEFLGYRDNNEQFAKIKEDGKVGLPCLVIKDGDKEQVVFDINGSIEYLKEGHA